MLKPNNETLQRRVCGDRWRKQAALAPQLAFRFAEATSGLPVAATLSLCAARLIGMQEAYRAAIATLVVMQSTLASTLTTSLEHIIASALSVSLGAVESTYFGSNLIAFALAIFLFGLLSFVLLLEKTGYRYASVTLTIIVHRGVELGSLSLSLLLPFGKSGSTWPITLMLSNAYPAKRCCEHN